MKKCEKAEKNKKSYIFGGKMRIPKGGIAFFDSGIGGLTVLSECRNRLPDEIFYYYGDNTHAPYGNLTEKEIEKYVFKAFRRFAKLRVRAAVIACNTATAVCIEALREKYAFPIVGAEPALFSAARKTSEEVFVLTTCATANSTRLNRLLTDCRNRYPSAKLRVCPCERLAEEIELHVLDSAYAYSDFLPRGKPSAVVLGCTHYIYIKQYISDFYACEAFDGNKGIAERLCFVLRGDSSQDARCLAKTVGRTSCDRDGRPHCTTGECSGLFFHRKRTFSARENEKSQQRDRSSFRKTKKSAKPDMSRACAIFFLGKRRRYNRKIYDQMFENGRLDGDMEKSGCFVVKKSKKN